MTSLFNAAQACLAAATVEDKLTITFDAAAALGRGELAIETDAPPPEPIRMPGRPVRPRLVHPRDLPRRGFGSAEGRAAFLHAVAHDEARHFAMLRERLRAFGHDYGDFDVHNGLWEMAEKTAHDGLARMTLVPRVLEARGLDVTPGMIVKLRSLGDHVTAGILETILREEVAHVAAGSRWYRWHCARARRATRALPRLAARTRGRRAAQAVQYSCAAAGGLRCRRTRKPAGRGRVTVTARCGRVGHTPRVASGGLP